MLDYEKFKNRRKELGLSQTETAELCGVGVSVIARYEKGIGIRVSTKKKLFDGLFDESEPKKEERPAANIVYTAYGKPLCKPSQEVGNVSPTPTINKAKREIKNKLEDILYIISKIDTNDKGKDIALRYINETIDMLK